MAALRDSATVRVSTPVNGTRRGRGKGKAPSKQVRKLERHVEVDPAVWEAVKKARRKGEKVRIVSETEVWLVNAS